MMRSLLLALALLACALPLAAQGLVLGPPAPDTGGVGFHAIGLVTEARPALAGERMRELYLTQPVLVLRDPGPRFSGQITLNFEAWTLGDGELNAGTWGEGYVDRRHPHTFLHEVVVTAHAAGEFLGASLTGGRGFVPFGSDDPMARPFVKYPSNHHLAQILERWVAVGAVRVGPLAVEAAAFNGDEPDGPRSTGDRSRFGDSQAARLTLWPFPPLELQVSRALVDSPEHPDGGGLDHRKWHGSGRLAAAPGGLPMYALYEWARTDEHDGGARAFSFESALFEAAFDAGPLRVAGRWERTTRPEEARIEDPFRSARPHEDATLLGITRWRGLTLHLAHAGSRGELSLAPFVEVSRQRAQEIAGGVFDPVSFYGSEVQWSLSAGIRVHTGIRHGRAGRYGVGLSPHAHGAMGPRR
jgi:hypothetical protein